MTCAFRLAGALAGLLLALALGLAGPARAQPYDIHVVLPMTGGGSFVGKGQQENLNALEAEVNKNGGIGGGRTVRFVYHDDQSTPQVAVQLLTEIIAMKPTVVLGSGLVAMCNAMAPLVQTGPVHYCLSPAFHPQPGSYSFSASASSIDQIAALIRYYRLKGYTKIAQLSGTDATGQDSDTAVAQLMALPENSSLKIVETQHFNPTDVSIAAQAERIRSSGAQAIIAWATGAPVATILKGVIQAGLDLPIAPSSGNQTFAQMDQYKSFLPRQFLLPSALFPEHDGILTLDPRIEKAQHDMYAILKERGVRADNMSATSWDAGLIVVEGLRKLGPNATPDQLRTYIASLTDFAGVNGLYDFKKNPERGIGGDSAAIMAYDKEKPRWVWLSKPGGEPLGK